MSPGKLVDEKDVGCQDKSGPGKIHEVILVYNLNSVNVVLVEVTHQHCLETNSNLKTPIGPDQLPPKNFVSFFIMRNARK